MTEKEGFEIVYKIAELFEQNNISVQDAENILRVAILHINRGPVKATTTEGLRWPGNYLLSKTPDPPV